jgi:hypothetical protein
VKKNQKPKTKTVPKEKARGRCSLIMETKEAGKCRSWNLAGSHSDKRK